MKGLEEVLNKAVADHEVAGINVLVLKDGQELAYAQAGHADREAGKAYTRDTIARMYSMTKPVTAAATMILIDQGELEVGQAVEDILPSFKKLSVWEDGRKVPLKRKLLIKDVLTMTSGLSYPGDITSPSSMEVQQVFNELDSRLHGEAPMSTLEFADRIAECGLAFQPGEKWLYGTSADILGAVIEKVSGMRFGEFLEKELFGPLGMHDTGFYVPADKQDRLAKVYETVDGEMREYFTENLGIRYDQSESPAFEAGGAGLVSTIDDYAKFATMLLNNGEHEGRQILSKAAVRYMTSGGLAPWQLESLKHSWESLYGYDYNCFMRILEKPGSAYFYGSEGEYGWDGWLGAYFSNSPKEKVTILMTCQKRDAGTMEVTRKVRNIIGTML